MGHFGNQYEKKTENRDRIRKSMKITDQFGNKTMKKTKKL